MRKEDVMKIALGCDHAGYRYKEEIKQFLTRCGHEVRDFGTHSDARVDYPSFVWAAARAVADGACERGIVLGGSGNGEAIVSNRIAGIRCTIAWNLESARLGRAHNDANMLSIGQRMMELSMALAIVETWLATPFDGGRHVRRLEEIDELARGGA
jgi:ribose 5-phosphate isomerase B